MATLEDLRLHAISESLFPPTTLSAAIRRLGFVQADPIRSPARAQDLILRHRVRGYQAGDLERHYPSLDIEEDLLYAYGFMPRSVWQCLHPRSKSGLSSLERKVLDLVTKLGETHPRALETPLGRKRIINAWGGQSKATTGALEDLRHRGLLRIARRDKGIRIYEVAPSILETVSPSERLRKLIMVMATILAPVPQKTLMANIARYSRMGDTRKAVAGLVHDEELQKATVDGLIYLWPRRQTVLQEPPRRVRFLAPFDPVVWDRRRFEHLWGWPYRFEAYTPPPRRLRGYYAMPLLWRDRVVGWANAFSADGHLQVEVGFVQQRPKEPDFHPELNAEIGRMEVFLGIRHLIDKRRTPGASYEP